MLALVAKFEPTGKHLSTFNPKLLITFDFSLNSTPAPPGILTNLYICEMLGLEPLPSHIDFRHSIPYTMKTGKIADDFTV